MTLPNHNYQSVRRLEELLEFKRPVLEEIIANRERHYHEFIQHTTDAAGKPKDRPITEPIGDLRKIQSRIKTRIIEPAGIKLPEGMMGAVKGESVKHNAEVHAGQDTVVAIDISKCFPSIKTAAIAHIWQHVFKFDVKAAALLAELTTYKGALPQGTPTSSALCNIVLAPTFEKIQVFCQSRGINASIWVDDVALSGGGAVDAIGPVNAIIRGARFRPNTKKLKVMRAGRKKGKSPTVTGLPVSRHVTPGKERIEGIRHAILGLKDVRQVSEKVINQIKGRISFVRSISPKQGDKLARLYESVPAPAIIPSKIRKNTRRNQK